MEAETQGFSISFEMYGVMWERDGVNSSVAGFALSSTAGEFLWQPMRRGIDRDRSVQQVVVFAGDRNDVVEMH